jgi:membrane fusion protein (multidrug efflux system)
MKSLNSTTIAAALALATVAFTACEKPKAPLAAPTEIPVRTALVTARDVPNEYEFPATITSPQMVDINARVPGWLLAQVTPDGATVKKGQILYTIDPSQYRIALDAANAQLAQAQAQADAGKAKLDQATAQLVYTQATFDRNKDLVGSGAVSKEKFDQYTAQLAEAKASVEQARADIAGAQANELAAKASIENATLNLSYCTIASPLDGMMGESKYFEGSLVGDAAKQLLNTVVQTDPMWAGFSPSANYLPQIIANQADGTLTASVRLEGTESAPVASMPLAISQDSPTATGRLVFINNEVSGSTDTILLRIEFPNAAAVFRPGAYAMVTLGLGTQRNAIVVPKASVFARQTDLFVWKVVADGTVESVRITALSAEGNDIIVTDGVNPGDRIVTEGIARLRPGSKIKDLGAATAAPAETAAETPSNVTPAAKPAANTASGRN